MGGPGSRADAPETVVGWDQLKKKKISKLNQQQDHLYRCSVIGKWPTPTVVSNPALHTRIWMQWYMRGQEKPVFPVPVPTVVSEERKTKQKGEKEGGGDSLINTATFS